VPANLEAYYLSDAYISHNTQASNIVDHVYKLARKFTLRWKHDLIRKYYNGNTRKLLDYGCGTGTFLQSSLARGWSITGVEPSPIARDIASNNTGTLIAAKLSEIGIADYDIITLWHVLEHVPDLNETLQSLHSKLANNGFMFIAVPNYKSYDATKYKDYWAAYDVPRHLWHFSQETMQKLLTTHGFKLHATVPMKLDSFYVSILSEKYHQQGKHSPTTFANGIATGLKSNLNAAEHKEYSSLIYIVRK
jgi:SAM-dependent methyltransferase